MTQAASAPAPPAINGDKSSAMDFILGPDEPQAQELDSAEGSAAGDGNNPAPEADAEPPATEAAAPEDELAALAAREGLDPKNPAHVKLLKKIQALEKRVNDGQDHIKKLQSKQSALTEFERQLAEAETEQQQRAEQQPVAEKPKPEAAGSRNNPVQPGRYGDIGDSWKSPEDAVVAYSAAWQKFGSDDPAKSREALQEIAAIENAAFLRRFEAHSAPLLDRVQQLLDQRFEQFKTKDLSILPELVEERARAKEDAATDFAEEQIRANPEDDATLSEMLVRSAPKATFEFDGKRFPDTPFHRILAENPHMLQAQIQHKDPATALKLTKIALLRSAITHYRAQQGKQAPETAKKLVETGKAIQQKAQAATVRQQMNSGAPSGGTRKSATGDDFMDGLLERGSTASGMSVASLLKR